MDEIKPVTPHPPSSAGFLEEIVPWGKRARDFNMFLIVESKP
jgi:hypothetical protein